MSKKVTIDLIGRNSEDDEYILILVEEGPWDELSFEDRLRKIQDRVYGVVDAAIDGALIQQYPDSKGQKICVQIDCYDPPSDLVKKLVKGLGNYISDNDEYQKAIKREKKISSIRITYYEGQL